MKNLGPNEGKKAEAPLGFEPRISCLQDRRFNQLSHRARRSTTSEKTFKSIFFVTLKTIQIFSNLIYIQVVPISETEQRLDNVMITMPHSDMEVKMRPQTPHPSPEFEYKYCNTLYFYSTLEFTKICLSEHQRQPQILSILSFLFYIQLQKRLKICSSLQR